MARSNPKLLIHGSCVSRDAFTDRYPQAARYELVGYLARSSLATAFSTGEVEGIDFDAIASPFQRRMVQSDVAHGLSATLASGGFDLLLVDLIDERFSLFVDELGARCTVSGELLSSGFEPGSRRGQVIRPFTDEFFELWEEGWRAIVAVLNAHGRLRALVVNEVYWSKACSDGTDFMPSYSNDDIDQANAFMRRQYARMRVDLDEDQFLQFDASLLVGAVDHQWGKSPFHFINAYYTNLLDSLERYSTEPRSTGVGASDKQGSGVGFVKYFQDKLRLAGSKFRHEEVEQATAWHNERVTLQKAMQGLEVSVRATCDTRIRMSAIVNGDLSGNRNLLLVVDGEGLIDAEMHAMGYAKSWVGYFRYLKSDMSGDQLRTGIAVNAKVTSFKILTWNFEGPVLLFDLNFESGDATLSGSMLKEKRRDDGHSVNIVREPAIRTNMLLKKHRCGPECIVQCDKWFSSMDAFASRHNVEKYGRDPVFIEAASGELLPASLQKSNPAFLTIPESVEAYLRSIGDKSRNMIQKATKLGYEFLDAGPAGFEQDIYEIRTSDPMRQGRPIPQYYYSNPPVYVMSPSTVGCEYHTERFFGIVRDGRLVSYITLFMFGELAQINHILCHKEHVKNGVMNLNVFRVVKELIEKFPWVKAINYLYVSDDGLGINLFKRSVGFKSERFIAYDSTLDALQLAPVDDGANHDVAPRAEPSESQKPRVKLTKWQFVRESVQRASLAAKLESLLERPWTDLPHPSDSEFAKFCSSGLGEATESHPVGACFLVPFPSRAEEHRHPDVARYLARRFKGNPIPDDGFSVAFRGGNLRALAYFGIEEDSGSLFDGVLVLEKVA
ncbi:DUF6270 domain-containing protein [Burkholderia sp. Ac-20353]|uniref:DUF6270 domain-containing protein n=1 Tax=Burkholderia sp. Ac-20353 TaxID=2703894 RepID=UPI00197BA399|nr:DUF6270 domain-containing protein [Burkholderia sp. Ac-20353]MBN3789409.1 N-acetyltransferase [Burkholderia sp. Ac-20353]